MRFPSHLATVALLAASTLAAHADTVYSTFGPGQTYSTTRGWTLGGFSSTDQVVASSFMPTETVTLSDAVLPLGFADNGSSPVNLFIESDLGGAPGSIVDTLTQVGYVGTTPTLVDFTCSSCSVLDAGTTYWIVAQDSYTFDEMAWNLSLNLDSRVDFNEDGSATGPWTEFDDQPLPAYAVNGTLTTTPEPSALALLGTGILGLAGVAHRKLAQA